MFSKQQLHCLFNSHKLVSRPRPRTFKTKTKDLQDQDQGPSRPRPRTFKTKDLQDQGPSRPRTFKTKDLQDKDFRSQDRDQDQDFQNSVSRRLETKTQVSRTTSLHHLRAKFSPDLLCYLHTVNIQQTIHLILCHQDSVYTFYVYQL